MQSNRMSSFGLELIMHKPLDVHTITETLNRLFPSLQLHPSDIQKPTDEIMCEIYQHITQYIMDIPDAVYTTPPLAYSNSQETDLQTYVYPKLVIFQALSAIVEDISSNELQFSFLDLIAPEPGPTRILLSTLINFIEYTNGGAAKAHEIFNSVDERKVEIEMKRRSVIELNNEVQRFRNETNNRKRLENEIREKMENLVRDVKNVFIENETLSAELKKLEEINSENKKKSEELQNEGKQLKSENEEADRDIVNSPDRLQAELDELAAFLKSCGKKVSAERRRNHEHKKKLEHLAVSARAIDHAMEFMDKVSERKKEASAANAALDAIEEQHLAAVIDRKSAECDYDKEKNKMQQMEKEFEEELILHNQEMKNINEHLATLNEQVKNIRQRMQDSEKENMEVQREVGKVKSEMAALNRTFTVNVANLVNQLEEVVNEYLELEKICNYNFYLIDKFTSCLGRALSSPDDQAGDCLVDCDARISCSIYSDE